MNRLKDKVAIVTGGSRGIGRAIVEAFLEEGVQKVYSIARNPENYTHPNLSHEQLSTTDRIAIAALAEKVMKEVGRVDILVNNAGITRDALLVKMQESDWDDVININLKGVFNMTQVIAPLMMQAGQGSIINISSIVAECGNIGQTNYAASKAGMIGMTYTWAKEFTRKGAAVRTNAITPGYIETEMVLSIPENVLAGLRAKNPLGRFGKPQDIANAVVFLASDEAGYVNGHVLAVNGGHQL